LNDTQSRLLSHASQALGGSLSPLPAGCAREDQKTIKAVTSLLRRELLKERETRATAEVWRSDEEAGFGLFITPAGLTAIGVEAEVATDVSEVERAPSPPPPPAPSNKIADVLALLGRADGATSAELIDATGWLPHTTRAALTGLRKKGHCIERSKRGELTCYRIAGCCQFNVNSSPPGAALPLPSRP
jgi:hypothetical protein